MSLKYSKNILYSPKRFELLKIKYLFIGLFIGLFFTMLIVLILTYRSKYKAVKNTPQYHPATFAIVEKFLCGCPNCEMDLKSCYCSDVQGGIYEMYYISQLLKEGLSEQQVIKSVYAKFGKIKNEYRYLVENNEQFLHNRGGD